MIGSLAGKVAAKRAEGCFLEVGGVGYKLSVSTTTLASLPPEGQATKLWTYLQVREDALNLYGFATEEEQRMFEALLSVAGVGPKVALQVCSSFSPTSFRRALVTGDVDGISSVPGIGKKTAQRILVDLKEKMQLPDLDLAGARPDSLAKARSALENLGYSSGEVRVVLAEAAPDEDASVEEVIKLALKALA
jgi:Holliday junction DNA helicase RuvA